MQTLELVRTSVLAFREVPAPSLEAPTEALVRPIAVARCDLDRAVLRGEAPFRGRALHFLRDRLPASIGQRRLFRDAPFRGPYHFGHEAVAEVLEVGARVRPVRPGDVVLVSFQICCGECARCLAGHTASCTTVPARSMYGFGALGGHRWGGMLSDVVRVPFADAMLVPLPAGLEPAAMASVADNVVDGYRAVAPPLAARPGGAVLVMGGSAASIGLYAAGLAVALGASEVHYVDDDPARRAIAVRLGAHAYESIPRRHYPVTVDACADPAGLAATLRATEEMGTCTSVGIYYTPTTPLPLLEMYGRGVTFVTGRAHSRALLPAVLPLLASGAFRPELVTTLHRPWAEAPRAFLDPSAKVVVSRPRLSA